MRFLHFLNGTVQPTNPAAVAFARLPVVNLEELARHEWNIQLNHCVALNPSNLWL